MEAEARRYRWKGESGGVQLLGASVFCWLGEFALRDGARECRVELLASKIARRAVGLLAGPACPAGCLFELCPLPGSWLPSLFHSLATRLVPALLPCIRLTAAAQSTATRQRTSSISLVTLVSCKRPRACFSSVFLSLFDRDSHFQPRPFSASVHPAPSRSLGMSDTEAGGTNSEVSVRSSYSSLSACTPTNCYRRLASRPRAHVRSLCDCCCARSVQVGYAPTGRATVSCLLENTRCTSLCWIGPPLTPGCVPHVLRACLFVC